MCAGLIKFEPLSDPKLYEPKDPRDIKIEDLEDQVSSLHLEIEAMKKKSSNADTNATKNFNNKLKELSTKFDSKLTIVENKMLTKYNNLEQKMKDEKLKEEKTKEKNKRTASVSLTEKSGLTPEKKKLPGPSHHVSLVSLIYTI